MDLEDVVGSFLGRPSSYLPGGAGPSLAVAPSGRGLALGLATMSAYAAIMTLAGGRAMRRDVT